MKRFKQRNQYIYNCLQYKLTFRGDRGSFSKQPLIQHAENITVTLFCNSHNSETTIAFDNVLEEKQKYKSKVNNLKINGYKLYKGA